MQEIEINICRICEENDQLINIVYAECNWLVDLYLLCANVTYDVADKLPKFFCKKCIKKLESAHQFKQQCESTYNKFMKYFQTLPGNDIIDDDAIETKPEFFEDTEKIIIKNENIDNCLEIESDQYAVESLEILIDPYTTSPSPRKKKTYECDICSNKFKLKSRLEQHLANVHHQQQQSSEADAKKKAKHVCSICDETFKHASNLCHHKKTVHLGIKRVYKSIPCDICGNIFATNCSLKRHIRIVHDGEKSFVCTECGKKFGQLVGLNVHISTVHHKERKFKCEQCPKAYATKDKLQTHELIHLPIEKQMEPESKIKRTQYTKIFNEKRIICEICGKSMIYPAYNGHMRMHDGIKPYKCSVCPLAFGTNQKLKLHSAVHSDLRPYKCEICQKTFRHKGNIYEHMIRHSGEKRYECKFCDKKFSLPFNLRLHERIHTGEKPYKCNLCPEKYTNSGALRKHASSVHSGQENVAVTLKPKQYVAERWR